MIDIAAAEGRFLADLHLALPRLLPDFLSGRRWFGGKARVISTVEILDIVPVYRQALSWYLVLARVTYASGPAETYDVPVVRLPVDAPRMSRDSASVMRLRGQDSQEEIVLVDALSDERFLATLLDAIAEGGCFRGAGGEVRAVPTQALATLWQPSRGSLSPSLMNAEQSNSSVIYGQCLVLKIFRRVEEGLNPDLEIGTFLTEKTSFRNAPAAAGYLEYVSQDGKRTSLGVLQGYVANQGDAWQFTLENLAEYYKTALEAGGLAVSEIPDDPILALSDRGIPGEARQRIGRYLEAAELLGRRTAELHLALASEQNDPEFTPIPFSQDERQTLVNSSIALLTSNFDLLRRRKDAMPVSLREEADTILGLEEKARQRFQTLGRSQLSAMLTRIHGDYHLGQVLYTGSDFVIIDFEGEPARPLQERRKKRSPLQDVAGMLRSFHYAAYAPLLRTTATQDFDANSQALGDWACYWQKWVSAVLLKTYLEVSRGSLFIPESREELVLLLDAHLLDKAVYELGYELNNRPSWVGIPLGGISQLLVPG